MLRCAPTASIFLRWALPCLIAGSLAGCASDEPAPFTAMPREPGRSVALDTHQKPLQCVPYAREHSAYKIFGDAWTWWDQAAGKFPRGALPQAGAVMVLTDYAGPNHGHLAVVKRIVSPREIRIDHANWLNDGAIYINDPVEDVSAGNDWSKVRVYNIKTGGWGTNIYPVQGFIGGTNSASILDGREAPTPENTTVRPPEDEAAPAVPPEESPDLSGTPPNDGPQPGDNALLSDNIPVSGLTNNPADLQ